MSILRCYIKCYLVKKSGADSNLIYKTDEVNIANNWNPDAKNPKEFGGFNFSIPQNIIRWIHRGDTIYDVTLPTSAQFRNIKNYSILKGKMIIMRTSIDTCYERCINRYSSKNIKIDFLEEKKYKDKKMGMYKWYKSLNEFIKNVYDNVINEEK